MKDTIIVFVPSHNGAFEVAKWKKPKNSKELKAKIVYGQIKQAEKVTVWKNVAYPDQDAMALEEEWNGLNEQYLKNETVMSDKEKKVLVEKIQKIEAKFRTGQEKIQTDLQRLQQEELSKIRAIVETAITEYAEKNNFDLIIRADGTTLYAKKYINITQEIISRLQ